MASFTPSTTSTVFESGGALGGDVIGRDATPVREPECIDVLGADVRDVAQVQRAVLAPADDQVAEFLDRLAARDAYGELAPADIRESGRDVAGRDDRLGQTLRG